jgi:two-component sensor histidine kinase
LQSARLAEVGDFARDLTRRLHGLAANQDLLIGSDWRGVDLMDLMRAQLSPFGDLVGKRIFLDGPSARLTPGAAQAIGMAVHELATNAAKYGPLSVDEGRIQVAWQLSDSDDPVFSLQWIERGGPKVSPPNRKGFGHMVIGRAVEAAVEGKVEIGFPETGLTWKLQSRAGDTLEAR